MALETGTRIPDLVATNPVGATDFVSQGDDHIRLLKKCIQGSFPALGSGQCAASADELGYMDGVTSGVQSQLDNKQPLDGDLTAIAALTTTSFGRSVLTQADASALRTLADIATFYQPLDSDLTAIAALATQSYGRGFLTLADNAELATKIAAMAPTWTGLHVFDNAAGNCTRYNSTAADGPYSAWSRSGTAFAFVGNAKQVGSGYTQDGYGISAATIEFGTTAGPNIRLTGGVFSALSGVKVKLPRVQSSSSTTLVAGQAHFITGNATIPTLNDGEWIAIFNNSGSAITLTTSGNTTYWSGAGAAARTTVTLAPVGMCVIMADNAGANAIIAGDITGST